MTVTYTTPWPGLGQVRVPRLHRVTYDLRLDVSFPAIFQRSIEHCQVDTWLKAHCRHPYYHSPGYIREKFVEFECDQDAAFFALRWGV